MKMVGDGVRPLDRMKEALSVKQEPHRAFAVGGCQLFIATVAQVVEQLTCNQQVGGSNPSSGFRKSSVVLHCGLFTDL